MNRTALTAGMSALALCVAPGGFGQGVAVAGERAAAQPENAARINATKATKALAKRDAVSAVRYAELAVALQPRNAEYRALLGHAYLLGGRFASANTALADSLTLSPGDGKVALNLALAQIAQGDWLGARRTLDGNAGAISISDRGLALALAGDPVSAVDLMLPVARRPGADAKLRQNLALSLALGGRWQDARMVAGMDLSPTDTDRRIEEWAAFARPTGRADQVAALLGITPASDAGQPVGLALNTSAPAAPVAVAVAAPAPTHAVDLTPAIQTGAVAAAFQPAAVSVSPMQPKVASPRIVFGPRFEVVQPLPIYKAAAPSPAKSRYLIKSMVATNTTPGASKVSVGKGNFYVQLGTYDSAGVARAGWVRASRVYSGFAGRVPQGMPVTLGGKPHYRLSVGGFDKAGALRVCAAYRTKGGQCFVRTRSGDTAASWAKS